MSINREDMIVAQDYITVYGKARCSYCQKAKELLESKSMKYDYIDLETQPDLHQKLINTTQQKTVPYVFVMGKFIGGYDDLKALSDAGELEVER